MPSSCLFGVYVFHWFFFTNTVVSFYFSTFITRTSRNYILFFYCFSIMNLIARRGSLTWTEQLWLWFHTSVNDSFRSGYLESTFLKSAMFQTAYYRYYHGRLPTGSSLSPGILCAYTYFDPSWRYFQFQ